MTKTNRIVFLIILTGLLAQPFADLAAQDPDPCFYNPRLAKEGLQLLGPGWGYTYDSLLVDLERWRPSPFVAIDSVGASVQNRALWLLTITDTVKSVLPRFRITMHVRTHPSEVESFRVTDEVISILLADTPLSRKLRERCIFNILPMYNPDGVELGNARENANDIDIERNWDATWPEPEVSVLMGLFEQYMVSPSPISIALNMHSASGRNQRYFVYHHENGTSLEYTFEEKKFIGAVRSFWPEGIAEWNEFISWTAGTPPYYPESWFWLNHREAVMALTYEEIFLVTDKSEFYRSALALLEGISDYLGLDEPTGIRIADSGSGVPEYFDVLQCYPNPAASSSPVNIALSLNRETNIHLSLRDITGRKIMEIAEGSYRAGRHVLPFRMPDVASGTYYLYLVGSAGIRSIPIMVIR